MTLIRVEFERATSLLSQADQISPGMRMEKVAAEVSVSLHRGEPDAAARLFEQYRHVLTLAGSRGSTDVVRALGRASDAVLAFGDDQFLSTPTGTCAGAHWFKFFPTDGADAADVVWGALAAAR